MSIAARVVSRRDWIRSRALVISLPVMMTILGCNHGEAELAESGRVERQKERLDKLKDAASKKSKGRSSK